MMPTPRTETDSTDRLDASHLPVPVAVLVVDDQLAVREGLARLIAHAPLALRAVTTAASGAKALRMFQMLRPEVVVLDADLAGEDGLALIPRFAPEAGVVVLTCHGDAATRERAARLGARGFVEKHQPASELLASIAAIASAAAGWDKPPVPAGASDRPMSVASSLGTARQPF